MSKDQALRLALEALESHIVWFSRDTMIGKAMRKKAEDSITAIKQALEQPVATNNTSKDRVDETAKQRHEPESVAWGVDWGKAGETPCVSIIKRLSNGNIEVVAVEYGPKRKWQGLTDDEIDALPFPPSGTATLRDFVRIIEAAHGIFANAQNKGEA